MCHRLIRLLALLFVIIDFGFFWTDDANRSLQKVLIIKWLYPDVCFTPCFVILGICIIIICMHSRSLFFLRDHFWSFQPTLSITLDHLLMVTSRHHNILTIYRDTGHSLSTYYNLTSVSAFGRQQPKHLLECPNTECRSWSRQDEQYRVYQTPPASQPASFSH